MSRGGFPKGGSKENESMQISKLMVLPGGCSHVARDCFISDGILFCLLGRLPNGSGVLTHPSWHWFYVIPVFTYNLKQTH